MPTPQRKERPKKFDKVQFVINIILCILPILAIFVYSSWNNSQAALIDTLTTQLMSKDNERFDKELLKQVELLDKANDQGDTLLMRACRQGRADIVIELLEMGANPNAHPRGALTPLELYCKYGYKGGSQGLLKLLKAGASPNIYTEERPLKLLAIEFKWVDKSLKEEVSKEAAYLLQAGDSINFGTSSLVHYAAQYNFSDLLESLISTDEGMQYLMQTDANGNYPYDLAVKHGAVQSQRVIRELDSELNNSINDDPFNVEAAMTPKQPESTEETSNIPAKSLEELIGDLEKMNAESELSDFVEIG